MRRFCLQFSSIAGAWCFMNSCHSVERSIRNTCKLCAICAKLSFRNAQICGRTKIGFCTMITALLTHRCLRANFFPKTTIMMPQPPYFLDLAPCDFFLFPKLKRPMKGRRYAVIEKLKTASRSWTRSLKMIFWSASRIGDYFEGDTIYIHE